MKKLFGFLAIVLTGMLIFAACPNGTSSGTRSGTTPDTTPGTTPDTVKLEKIKKAYDVKWGVKEAVNASEVAKGVNWVTKAEMTALNRAIEVANNSRSIRSAETDLDAAIDKFEKAKKEGDAEAITLSGTITVKDSRGQQFFVQINPFFQTPTGAGVILNGDATRVVSPSNSPWSIIIKKSDLSFYSGSLYDDYKEVGFSVIGYEDDSWDYFGDRKMFSIAKEIVNYDGEDISNINIVLNTNTVSGTIISSNDKPIPYVTIWFGSGTAYIMNLRNKVSWSITTAEDDFIIGDRDLTIFGQINPLFGPGMVDDDTLFWTIYWGYKGQDFTNIKLTVNPIITLSGTVNVTYDGRPVPVVFACSYVSLNDDLFSKIQHHNGNTKLIQQPGYFAPWSTSMEGFDKNTDITLQITGQDNFNNVLFDWLGDITVKDQSKSGIVLDLGEMKGTEWDKKK